MQKKWRFFLEGEGGGGVAGEGFSPFTELSCSSTNSTFYLLVFSSTIIKFRISQNKSIVSVQQQNSSHCEK